MGGKSSKLNQELSSQATPPLVASSGEEEESSQNDKGAPALDAVVKSNDTDKKKRKGMKSRIGYAIANGLTGVGGMPCSSCPT